MAATNPASPPLVEIYLRGGIVQGARSNTPGGINVRVVDFDVDEKDANARAFRDHCWLYEEHAPHLRLQAREQPASA